MSRLADMRRGREGRANDPLLVALAVLSGADMIGFVIGKQFEAWWAWMPDVGQLLYDLALAYLTAYTFFVLVEALPRQREEAAVRRHQLPRCERLLGRVQQLVEMVRESHPDLRVSLTEEAGGSGAIVFPSRSGLRRGTWLDRFGHHLEEHRIAVERILAHERLTPAVVVSAVEDLDNSPFIQQIRSLVGMRENLRPEQERIDLGLEDYSLRCNALKAAIEEWRGASSS